MIVSKIVSDAVQSDGRRKVTEKHTDDLGVVQFITYVCEKDFDALKALEDRKTLIEEENLKQDLDKCVKTLELPNKASPLDFILKIAELYKAAEGFEVARLASFLVSRGPEEVADLKLDFKKIATEAALFQTVSELRGA